jgi:hypothetical protein
MHGPLWSPAHHEGPPSCQSGVHAWTLAFAQPHADARLRGDARSCDARVFREELVGMKKKKERRIYLPRVLGSG